MIFLFCPCLSANDGNISAVKETHHFLAPIFQSEHCPAEIELRLYNYSAEPGNSLH